MPTPGRWPILFGFSFQQIKKKGEGNRINTFIQRKGIYCYHLPSPVTSNVRAETYLILHTLLRWPGHGLGVRGQPVGAELPKLLSSILFLKKKKGEGREDKIAIVSRPCGEGSTKPAPQHSAHSQPASSEDSSVYQRWQELWETA